MIASAMRWLLVLHLLLSPLVFSTATVEAFEENKVGLLLATAILLGALGMAEWLQRPTFAGLLAPFRTDWVCLGFLLFTVSSLVSCAVSVSPLVSWRGDHGSWFGCRTVAAYLVLFLATRHACRTTAEVWPLLAAVGAAVLLASVYALVQWAGHDPFAWTEVPRLGDRFRPFSTLGHPNFLGAYLAISLPLLFEFSRRSFSARRWLVGSALVVVAATACVVVVLTLSRAAWLATACMGRVLAAGWWWAGCRRAGLALVVLLGVGAAWALPNVGRERLAHLGDGGGRYPIWRTAWQLFEDRPLCGWGTDAFRLAFGKRRPVDYWQEEGFATPAKAHNEALHLLATQGALGAATALLVLAGLGRAAWRAWRQTEHADRPLIAVVSAGLVAFLVQGAFGFTVTGVGTLVVTLAAVLTRSQQSVVRQAERSTPFLFSPWTIRGGRLVIAVSAAVLLWFVVLLPFRASVACADGDRQLANDPAAALANYETAVRLAPESDRAWMKLSGAAQLLARRSAAHTRFDELASVAADQASALVPADPYHRATRARWFTERAFLGYGSSKAALDEWDAALTLDPDNAFLLAEAGRAALALGDRERGLRLLAHGRALYPDYAPFEARLGTLALAEGRLDEARLLLERAVALDWKNDNEDRARAWASLSATCLADGRAGAARDAAQRAADDAPDWSTPPYLLGQALEQLGRLEEAAVAYLRVLTQEPSHPAARAALAHLRRNGPTTD